MKIITYVRDFHSSKLGGKMLAFSVNVKYNKLLLQVQFNYIVDNFISKFNKFEPKENLRHAVVAMTVVPLMQHC